jgi:hypothetical protein
MKLLALPLARWLVLVGLQMGLMLVSASGFAQTPPLTCPVGSVPSDIKAIGAFMVERPPA